MRLADQTAGSPNMMPPHDTIDDPPAQALSDNLGRVAVAAALGQRWRCAHRVAGAVDRLAFIGVTPIG